jgi:hypothetical protein
VSAVVNGNKFVTDSTRERVLRAIAALDYRPDAIARSLKISRTNTIGLMLPSIESSFWPPVARATEARLRERGYRLFLATGRPLVFIERPIVEIDADCVAVDDFHGGFLAARHLLALVKQRRGGCDTRDLAGVRLSLARANRESRATTIISGESAPIEVTCFGGPRELHAIKSGGRHVRSARNESPSNALVPDRPQCKSAFGKSGHSANPTAEAGNHELRRLRWGCKPSAWTPRGPQSSSVQAGI